MRKTVAVDLDGVLARYSGWGGVEEIGQPIEGARNFLAGLIEEYKVVIHTTRCNPDPFNEGENRIEPEKAKEIIENWLDEHRMPYDRVFIGRGKPIAVAYVDDRAVYCRPQTARNSRESFARAQAVIERREG